jgi:hypothetical protein
MVRVIPVEVNEFEATNSTGANDLSVNTVVTDVLETPLLSKILPPLTLVADGVTIAAIVTAVGVSLRPGNVL